MRYLIFTFFLLSCASFRQPASDITNSPKLNFILNEYYLALHTIRGHTNWEAPKEKEIVAFQKKVWNEYEEDYKIIINFKKLYPDYLKNHKLKFMKEFAAKIIKYPEFAPIKERAQDYLEYTKREWESNLFQTSSYMTDLTGLDFKKSWEVYITHPALRNGTQLGPLQIGWGSPAKWPNHEVVYLWHEVLHHYFGKTDLDHAVIELTTDNELRTKMNNTRYPPFEGHDYLKKTMKEIFPAWKKYLKRENKNLVRFARGL